MTFLALVNHFFHISLTEFINLVLSTTNNLRKANSNEANCVKADIWTSKAHPISHLVFNT